MLLSVWAAAANTVPLEPAALDYTGIREITSADPNLTGDGVLIAAICRSMTYRNEIPLNDYRFNMDHDALYRGDVAFEDNSDGRFGISSHATAIAGLLIGQKDNAKHPTLGTFNYRGICPDAAVDVYEFHRFGLYLYEKRAFEADIITLSLGEKYEDWWTRALDNLAARDDRILIASTGNGQSDYHLLYPGAGANAIGVGVIDAAVDENGKLSLQEFSAPSADHSSSGPTDNNRCKPDIVAPGTAIVPLHNSPADYTIEKNWSSLAAPIVSGTAALLLQKAYADPTLSTDIDRPGKNALIKAILLNSAAKLPYWHKGNISSDDDTAAPLDYTQGTGALDAVAAMKQLTAGRQRPGKVNTTGWDNRVLNAEKDRFDYIIDAAEPNQMLTATLCWNRVYKNEFPFKHDLKKDTDLRLELWGVDPNEAVEDTLLDVSDSINDNVEHIYFRCGDSFAAYRICVRFNEQQELTDTTRQRFAVAFRVTEDTATGNRWWHDLNGDSRVDGMDHLARQLIDSKIAGQIAPTFLQQALKLSAERLALLQTHWADWKPYLTDFKKTSE